MVEMTLRRIPERMGLTLNQAKTRTVNAFTGRFDFPGFTIRIGKAGRREDIIPMFNHRRNP